MRRRFDTTSTACSGTHLPARVTARAQVHVHAVPAIRSHGDRVDRTMLCAERAADAGPVDLVADQRGAFAGRAFSLQVRFVFVAEVLERGQHGIGCRLAQPADAARHDTARQLFELFQIPFAAVARADAIQDLQHPLRADAAERALAARLVLREAQEVAGDVDHAIGVVEHHQSAAAHDRADLDQRLVVHRCVGQRGGDAAAGRTTHLHRLELASRQHAAADVLDDLPQGDAHRDLDQARRAPLCRPARRLSCPCSSPCPAWRTRPRRAERSTANRPASPRC